MRVIAESSFTSVVQAAARVAAFIEARHGRPVDVWLFTGADGAFALSTDETGAVLPEHLGPWERRQPYRLNAELEDEGEAVQLIIDHGYCCF